MITTIGIKHHQSRNCKKPLNRLRFSVRKGRIKVTIKEILGQWKKESGFTGVMQYKYNYSDRSLTLYIRSPGWLIGKGGCLWDKYSRILQECAISQVKFVETDYDSV